jgi:hypothetical protein
MSRNIEYEGIYYSSISKLAKKLNIDYTSLSTRIKKGASVEEAIKRSRKHKFKGKSFVNFIQQFKTAKAYVHGLKLNSRNEWKIYCTSGEKPKDIPSNPNKYYKEWISWGDWLGTGQVSTHQRKYRPFEKGKQFVRKLKLETKDNWIEYTKTGKLPNDIPHYPDAVYANSGWSGWGNWLGTGRVANQKRKFVPIEKAKKWAKKQKITSQIMWKVVPKPSEIPTNPEQHYKNKGWIDWGDFLGTGRIANETIIEAFGESKNILQWANDPRCQVKYHTLYARLQNSVPPEMAIKTAENLNIVPERIESRNKWVWMIFSLD